MRLGKEYREDQNLTDTNDIYGIFFAMANGTNLQCPKL
jgi:hypothetical protein